MAEEIIEHLQVLKSYYNSEYLQLLKDNSKSNYFKEVITDMKQKIESLDYCIKYLETS